MALLVACFRTPPSPRAEPSSDPVRPAIAVVAFGLAAGTPPPPIDVADVIRHDLVAMGRVTIVPESDLAERPVRLSEIRFERWRESDADYLVIGLIASVHDGGHEVEFRLVDPRIDPAERATLVGFIVASPPDGLEATAHRIATMIIERLESRSSGPAPTPRAAGSSAFPPVEPSLDRHRGFASGLAPFASERIGARPIED
ncbi:MAG: hypothetical protein R3F35_20555 [Myxococcota bacterium]